MPIYYPPGYGQQRGWGEELGQLLTGTAKFIEAFDTSAAREKARKEVEASGIPIQQILTAGPENYYFKKLALASGTSSKNLEKALTMPGMRELGVTPPATLPPSLALGGVVPTGARVPRPGDISTLLSEANIPVSATIPREAFPTELAGLGGLMPSTVAAAAPGIRAITERPPTTIVDITPQLAGVVKRDFDLDLTPMVGQKIYSPVLTEMIRTKATLEYQSMGKSDDQLRKEIDSLRDYVGKLLPSKTMDAYVKGILQPTSPEIQAMDTYLQTQLERLKRLEEIWERRKRVSPGVSPKAKSTGTLGGTLAPGTTGPVSTRIREIIKEETKK